MQIFEYFYDFVVCCSFLIAIAGACLYQCPNPPERKFIRYLILSYFFECLGGITTTKSALEYLRTLGIENNLPGLHLFTLLQFIFLLQFFEQIFNEHKTKIKFPIIMIIGCMFIIANSVFFQSIFTFNSYSKTLVELSIVCASLYYFYWNMNSNQILKTNKAIDLFVVAIFLNAAFSILIHLFSNQMYSLNEELLLILWRIRAVLNLISLLIIAYGLYLYWQMNKMMQKT